MKQISPCWLGQLVVVLLQLADLGEHLGVVERVVRPQLADPPVRGKGFQPQVRGAQAGLAHPLAAKSGIPFPVPRFGAQISHRHSQQMPLLVDGKPLRVT